MCGDCVDRCTSHALTPGDENVPDWQEERSPGFGVCAPGCEDDAINPVKREGSLSGRWVKSL